MQWNDKMIYIFFGEMGTGKNFVAERWAERFGGQFFDGDTVIPEPVVRKVGKFRLLTTENLDDYVLNYLIPAIETRAQDKHLMVAQALYRHRHRNMIRDHFGEKNVTFLWLPVPSLWVHMQRLRSRGWKWIIYGLLNKPFFQNPNEAELYFGDVLTMRNDKVDCCSFELH